MKSTPPVVGNAFDYRFHRPRIASRRLRTPNATTPPRKKMAAIIPNFRESLPKSKSKQNPKSVMPITTIQPDPNVLGGENRRPAGLSDFSSLVTFAFI